MTAVKRGNQKMKNKCGTVRTSAAAETWGILVTSSEGESKAKIKRACSDAQEASGNVTQLRKKPVYDQRQGKGFGNETTNQTA